MTTRTYSRIVLSPADTERASGALYRAGMLGGWEDEAEGAFIAAFADAASAKAALSLLQSEGIDARLEEAVQVVDPFAVHRASLAPFSVGSFRIDPRGEPDGGSEGADTLWIPAHGAFGTGLHASTRGILRWIDDTVLSGRRVLDVGCGSGILAIAAARRGAVATAFDVDADAVFEARRNLGRNGTRGVLLFTGEIGAVSESYDAVLANMIWEESAPIAGAIAARTAGGGTAVFSGVLDARESDAVVGIEAAGLAVAAVERDGEWRTIVAIRRR